MATVRKSSLLVGKQNWISVSQQLVEMCWAVNVCAYLCRSGAENYGRIMWGISWWQPGAYYYHGPKGRATVAMVWEHIWCCPTHTEWETHTRNTHTQGRNTRGIHTQRGETHKEYTHRGETHEADLSWGAAYCIPLDRRTPGAYLTNWCCHEGASLAFLQLHPSNWKLNIAAQIQRFFFGDSEKTLLYNINHAKYKIHHAKYYMHHHRYQIQRMRLRNTIQNTTKNHAKYKIHNLKYQNTLNIIDPSFVL